LTDDVRLLYSVNVKDIGKLSEFYEPLLTAARQKFRQPTQIEALKKIKEQHDCQLEDTLETTLHSGILLFKVYMYIILTLRPIKK
jgi:hypothetical protein